MANRRKTGRYRGISKILNKPEAPVANDAVAMDMFRNVAARMGYGTPSLTEATEYELIRWTNDYWLMITLYRNHWLSRRIIEKPAQHMTQAWPKLNMELEPTLVTKFNRAIKRTFTQDRIERTVKWARLFGGAGALMVIDGHEDILDEPLDLDTIAPGSYKGLIPFDRWSGINPDGNEVTDINSPLDFGYPEYYTVNNNGGEQFRVHHSRVLRFSGPEVPTPEHQAALYWGISELEVVYEELRKRDNMSWSILQLLFRAQILTQRNPELAQLLTGSFGGGKAAELYYRTMEAQNQLLSNQSMLILGENSELQSHQYTFGGVSEIYQLFRQDVVGASGIPEVILFGIQSKGFGESQEGDIRNYEMDIAIKQNTTLRPNLDKLYPVVCMSELGEVPDDLDFTFPSIRVLTEEEKTNLQKNGGQTIIDTFAAGLRSQKKSLMELKKLSEQTGINTTIDLKEIDEADDEVNVPLEIESSEARAGTEEFSEISQRGGGPLRDENGKFASSNARRAKGKVPPKAADSAYVPDYVHSFDVQGLTIVVETPKGEVRSGKGFSVTMPAHYGFIANTVGADGDEMDCYIGPNLNSKDVFVVHQSKLDGSGFDEHKCMIGYDTEGDALKDYFLGHHRSHDIFIKSEAMTMKKFKKWLENKGE